jgi:hypothetical protein
MTWDGHDGMQCRWTQLNLWDREDVSPFYKVVNIIQEQLLWKHVIYCILFHYKSRLLFR